jgi:hypothetical protein
MVLLLKVDGVAPARRLCHLQEGSRAGGGRPEWVGRMARKKGSEDNMLRPEGVEMQLGCYYQEFFFGLIEY